MASHKLDSKMNQSTLPKDNTSNIKPANSQTTETNQSTKLEEEPFYSNYVMDAFNTDDEDDTDDENDTEEDDDLFDDAIGQFMNDANIPGVDGDEGGIEADGVSDLSSVYEGLHLNNDDQHEKNKKENVMARVIEAYESRKPNEMTLRIGDIIERVERGSSDWWKGSKPGFSNQLFPAKCVKLIPPPTKKKMKKVNARRLPLPTTPDSSRPPVALISDQLEGHSDPNTVSGWRYHLVEDTNTKGVGNVGAGARPKLPTRPSAPVQPRLSRLASGGGMLPVQKKVIMRMWNVILDNIRAVDILDHLIEKEVLSLEMQQEIKAQQTSRDQTCKFLEILVTRGSRAYNIFLDAIKLHYDFIYPEFRSMEQSIQDDDDNIFNYHEPPMTGAALKNTISGFVNIVPESKRSRIQRKRDLKKWLKETEIQNRESQINSVGRRSGQMLKEWVSGSNKLMPGQYVVIIADDGSSNEISLLTRLGEVKVPRNYIKNFGDPKEEKYFYKWDKLKPMEAMEFVKQTVESSERDGVFVIYNPRSGCKCEFHLCVGFFKGTTKNYHIAEMDGEYSLQLYIDDTCKYDESSSEYLYRKSYNRSPIVKFKTVTDLVEYYVCTSDKVLDGVLQWPMLDAESFLRPGVDFDEKFALDKKEYTVTSNLIGRGYFADVTKGNIRGTTVAVKTPNIINNSIIKRELLFREAKILMSLSNIHIVKIIGVSFRKEKFEMLMEYASRGDLRTAVKRGKCNLNDLRACTLQIASGMHFLENHCIVHRDLALRNMLLFENNVVKIADFGGARKLYGAEHTYHVSEKDMLSYRWTAPEVFATLCYGIKADVWSYGVVIWEMYSVGQTPYEHLKTQEVMTFVLQGGRLEKPKKCPDDIFRVMCSCWNRKFDKRPKFSALEEALHLNNFKNVNPGVMASFMTEGQYAERIKTVMSLETYGEKVLNTHSNRQAGNSLQYEDVPEETYEIPMFIY